MISLNIKGYIAKKINKITSKIIVIDKHEKLSLDKKDFSNENNKKEFIINVENNKKYTLNIHSNVIDIDIKYVEGKEFKIYLDNYDKMKNKEKLTFEVDNIKNNIDINLIYKGIDISNNSINIAGRNGSINMCSSKDKKCDNLNELKLNIIVPKLDNILSDVFIKTISSDILVEEIKIEEQLKIKSTSGDINLRNNNVKNIELFTISGDIILNKSVCDKLNVKTTSGYISCDNLATEVANCNSINGDIDVCNCSGIEIDLKSTSGDISLSNIRYSDVNISTVSGDISLNNRMNLDYKIIKLKTKTTSGEENIIANY